MENTKLDFVILLNGGLYYGGHKFPYNYEPSAKKMSW